MGIKDIAVTSWSLMPEGCGLRLYTLRSMVFVFIVVKHREEFKNWPPFEYTQAIDHDNLAFVFLAGVRKHVDANTEPEDPREGNDCEYHSHGRDEECLVKKAT